MLRHGLLLCVLLASCGESATPAPAPLWTTAPATPPATLAAWGLFEGSGATQRPAEGVMPYAVNAPLFSDETVKLRFVAIPAGRRITYRDAGVWALPVGAVLVKTFAYPVDARDPSRGLRLLETRVMLRTAEGFIPHTYVWNDAQTEATRSVAGRFIDATWTDAQGAARSNRYLVPNTNQCLTCHGQRGLTDTLGLRTGQIDRASPDGATNQIDAMVARGWFDGAVPPAAQRVRFAIPSDEGASVSDRARAYLHANCAHCHNEADRSMAQLTGLHLDIDERDPVDLGRCRRPNSAGNGTGGLRFDVVPGDPDASILVWRMRSTDPALRMPQLPNNLVDEAGVAIVARWIREMPADPCPAP